MANVRRINSDREQWFVITVNDLFGPYPVSTTELRDIAYQSVRALNRAGKVPKKLLEELNRTLGGDFNHQDEDISE